MCYNVVIFLHPLPFLGYQLSNNALSSIILRYHNKKGTVPFDIFIQILVRVIVMFGKFDCPFIEKLKRKKKYFVIGIIVNPSFAWTARPSLSSQIFLALVFAPITENLVVELIKLKFFP